MVSLQDNERKSVYKETICLEDCRVLSLLCEKCEKRTSRKSLFIS